jgi:hypothetical protein
VVFAERRYKPSEQWLDADGRPFLPGVHYVVGGNSKVYGANLPRFREHDFEAVEHYESPPAEHFESDDPLTRDNCRYSRVWLLVALEAMRPKCGPQTPTWPAFPRELG